MVKMRTLMAGWLGWLLWVSCAALLSACGSSSSSEQDARKASKDAASSLVQEAGLPDGFTLHSCNNPGGSCNAHNSCAIDPICGADNLCRPARLQQCDDGLPCTEDICKGQGLCENRPIATWCVLPVQVGGVGGVGGADAGAPQTELRCFRDGDRDPTGRCLVCRAAGLDASVASDPTHWSPANGGACDDGNPCTKDDYCQTGVCKGEDYSKQCADTYDCTDDLCDGKGGCLGNKLRKDYCLINGICYKDKENDPKGSCSTCDVTKNQNGWTPLAQTCVLDSKCYKPGDKNPLLPCAECDPAASATSWTVNGNECLIDKVCKKPGEKDTIGCASCDPTKNKYAWTPLPGVCKINGQCYPTGTKNPGGCAECDPATSATAWTVKGSDCLIDGVCKKPGDKDAINCGACDPAKDRYGWTPIASLCNIGGVCHATGDQHPGGCAECDPSTSSTSWTVKGSSCLIDNACKAPGDTDALGCSACDPPKNRYGWSPLAGLCKVDGACQTGGAAHPAGCATCDPSKSTTSWTTTGSGCFIDFKCWASGATHPKGCGTCDPTKSATSWTVTSAGCLIGGACYSPGAKETGGCATCDPSKNATSWTRPASCLTAHLWSKSFGGTSTDYAYAVAADASGNSYVTGYFSGSIDFGGGALTSNGSSTDIFVASFTPSGQHRWSKAFGGTSSDNGYRVAVDASGNVYVTGSFYSSIDFGGGVLTANGSSTDMFVASFTPSGQHRWSKAFGGTSSDIGYGVAVDASGNVYLTGSFYGSIDFGGGVLTANGSSTDMFLASFTPSGQHRWSKVFGGTSTDYGYAVATDGAGNVYLTGYYYATIDFGGGPLPSKGSYDVSLASFTPAGAHRWSKSFGGTSSDYGYGLATDAGGNVYITGSYYTSIDFGGGPLTANGYSADLFLASFTSAGAHRWSKGFGGTSSDYGYGVATDSAGNVHLTGYFYTSIDFGGGSLTGSALSANVFLASFTSSGVHRWSRVPGSGSSAYGRSVATDGAGGLYAAGAFYLTVDFGGGPLTSVGSGDGYLVKLLP